MDITVVEQHSHHLGRQKVHDPASRGYALPRKGIDRSLWKDKAVRIYDPLPNPNQPVGCCTMCAKASQFNSIGNRRTGVVLGMGWALDGYRLATRLDPFAGSWEPDDTGSSGLASCKAAQQTGDGGTYLWDFDGADGVVQNIMEGRAMSVGTWWYEAMFYPDSRDRIRPEGDRAGGHQYVARAYDAYRDLVLIRCWWGEDYRDVWVSRTELDTLIRDGGDSHWQMRRQP